MKKRTLFIALCLLFIFAGPVVAQNGTIRGKVRAPTGATLTNIIVELWGSGAKMGQTVTTNDGDFYFSGLTPANYEVVINYLGYQPVSEPVQFNFAKSEGRVEIISVDITLKADTSKSPLAPAGVTFVQDVPPDARKAFEEGIANLKEGRSQEGISSLKSAIKIFPEYFNAQIALATELGKNNVTSKEALEVLEQARRINDRDARVYHLFGILMAQQRKFVVSEFAFREAIQRDPTNPQSYLSHAITLIELAIKNPDKTSRLSQLNEAEGRLKRALELSNRKLVTAYLQLARVCEYRGGRKAAAGHLETYLKLQPDDKNAATIREAIVKLNR